MPSEYQKVANIKDLKEGSLLRVEPGGKPIVLAMASGKVYAMDAVCSHEGGPLEEGKLEGYELTCPWHYAVFDVRNAKVSDKTVWATNLTSYPVQVDENTGDISVNLKGRQAEEVLQQKKAGGREEDSAKAMENEKRFYEEEDRKAADKLSLELLAKEKLEGTDIMTFKLARGELDYTAGQFAYFKLDGVSDDSKGPIRHFTIASSPTEQDLMISTRIRDTPYKQKLALLQNGTDILAWGPQGNFVLHDDYSKPAVFLSGGIGVTPFRSMIKYATDKRLPVKIVMFDSNRNKANILYKSEFDKWAQENKNFQLVYTLTDEIPDLWSGEKERIDRSMIERHLDKSELGNSIFYICGPPGMLKAMQKLMQEMQVPRERIKVEEFTGY
jgi:ferredoxin-NADP reductase/nitrite reductase/ring-hydroxylating ferredoxin subunit